MDYDGSQQWQPKKWLIPDVRENNISLNRCNTGTGFVISSQYFHSEYSGTG